MSNSLPPSEILAVASGHVRVRATVPWARRQTFAPSFHRFAQQFSAVLQNLPQHSQREMPWMS